ncbi:Transmembrane Protein [Agrobacterium tumefaciens]|nr:Transmembrane Protein [Agrobacterium tumefaciens]
MGKEMQGLFFETDNGVRYVLRALVVLLGFWTAWRTGKSVADGWGEYPRVVIYTLALGLVMRFLHFALFNGPFINGFYYVLDVVLLLVFSSIGFRMRRTSQMVNNYYWLYDRTSSFSYKKKN